jgi:hypothetical protein
MLAASLGVKRGETMSFDAASLINLLRDSLPEAIGGLIVAFIVGILSLLYGIRSRRRRVPNLSEEAKMLLIEASKDTDGIVLRTSPLGGTIIQTNNKPLSEGGNPRSEARWEAAIKDLCNLGLLVERDTKGQVYALTDGGYKLADRLKR